MNSQSVPCCIAFLLFLVTSLIRAQECQPLDADRAAFSALNQRIDVFALQNETLFDGIGRIDEQTHVSFALEIVGKARSESPKFNISFRGKSLQELLNLLTSLDPRFQWTADGRTINIVPRSVAVDERYLLNLPLGKVNIEQARDAGEAVNQVMQQALNRITQQGRTERGILLDHLGTSLAFGKPWSVTFSACTLRQAFNRISEKLGPNHGWQFSSTPDQSFRRMVFHSGLISGSGNVSRAVETR